MLAGEIHLHGISDLTDRQLKCHRTVVRCIDDIHPILLRYRMSIAVIIRHFKCVRFHTAIRAVAVSKPSSTLSAVKQNVATTVDTIIRI